MRWLLPLCASALWAFGARAQQTLPQGHFRVQLSQVYVQQTLPAFYLPHVLDEQSANALLQAAGNGLFGDVSPHDLSLLSPGMSFFGEGVATVTVSQIDYGVADWLTVSAIVPWYEVARVLPSVTANGALLGYNLDYDPRKPISLANFPLAAPLSASAGLASPLPTRAVTGTEGAQQIFTNVLGYHRAQRFDNYGIGDPYAALTFSLLRRPGLRAAGSIYAQFPVGRPPDPDDPFAVSFGDGHTAIGGRCALEDSEAGPLRVTLGARTLFPLRDHPILRVYTSSLIPLTGVYARERVSRLAGPQLGAFAGIARLMLQDYLKPFLNVSYDRKFPDHLRGSRPASDYAAVEDNSRWGMFSTEVGLAYTTVERFLAGESTFPGEISLSYYYQVQDHGLFGGLGQHRLWLTFSTFL